MAQTQQELDIIAERKRGEEEGAKPEGRASLDIKSAPVKMPTRPGQQPMVTMDMVKAKGFDNLRDYLNDQKGLKRRANNPANQPQGQTYENQLKFDPAAASAYPLEVSLLRTQRQQKAADLGKPYAKGGTVSGASKRADGIAQRGKTKGRMC